MSTKLSALFTWRSAIAESTLRPHAKLVALTLSLHMSERGDSCFPSHETLATETSLSVSAVRRALRTLETAGWLTRERRYRHGLRTTNTYVARVVSSDHVVTGGSQRVVTSGSQRVVSSDQERTSVTNEDVSTERTPDFTADAVNPGPFDDSNGMTSAPCSTPLGHGDASAPAAPPPNSAPPSPFDLAPYLDVWSARFGAVPSGRACGHLGKLLKPLEATHGRELLRLWFNFVTGINPKYMGSPNKQFETFAATPNAYANPAWHVDKRDKVGHAQRTVGRARGLDDPTITSTRS